MLWLVLDFIRILLNFVLFFFLLDKIVFKYVVRNLSGIEIIFGVVYGNNVFLIKIVFLVIGF